MFRIIANWIINALALYIVSLLLSGVVISNFTSAMIGVLVIGLVNALLKPILILLTLPINILSLGLFTFVVNACLLYLASSIVAGFEVRGFFTAIVASILLSIVTTILHSLTR